MREGLLWFDNDPKRSLADKVARAATRYQHKFRQKPTICMMNDADFAGKPEKVNGIVLKTAPNVLRHHLWIGVEGKVVTR